MIRNVFERLPLLFTLGAPLAGLLWAVLPYDFHANAGPYRLLLYGFYAASVAAITFTYYRFIRSSSDGRVAAWLVIAFYVELFFNLTLVGIFCLLLLRLLYPDPDNVLFYFRALYGIVGASASATFIGAVAALVGYRRGLLGMRIEPFPFGRKEE